MEVPDSIEFFDGTSLRYIPRATGRLAGLIASIVPRPEVLHSIVASSLQNRGRRYSWSIVAGCGGDDLYPKHVGFQSEGCNPRGGQLDGMGMSRRNNAASEQYTRWRWPRPEEALCPTKQGLRLQSEIQIHQNMVDDQLCGTCPQSLKNIRLFAAR